MRGHKRGRSDGLAPLRVLIVEDEPLIALLLEEVLWELGHHVCATERTEGGAIAASARSRPELIIADARLREGSGIEAVNAIIRSGFIPHIVVSGAALDRRSIHPAACVLQKPFHEAQLVQAIARAIDPATIQIGQALGDRHASNQRMVRHH